MIRYSIVRWSLRLLVAFVFFSFYNSDNIVTTKPTDPLDGERQTVNTQTIHAVQASEVDNGDKVNQNATPISNRLVMKVKPDKLQQLKQVPEISDSLISSNSLGFMVLQISDKQNQAAQLRAIEQHPDVEWIEADYPIHAAYTESKPSWSSAQAHHALLETASSWAITQGKEQLIIAVLDTGIDASHPALNGRLVSGYDFIEEDQTPQDENGHGTHVTGIAVANVDDKQGIAGICPNCKVMPLRVLDEHSAGSVSDVVHAITYAADHGASIINMSLTSKICSNALQTAIDYAWSKGLILIASAGNNGSSAPEYPAACKRVISVGAVNEQLQKASFSNFGETLDLVAPGTDIYSTSKNGSYSYMSGTSMATPMVSAIAALIWSDNPSLTNLELEGWLKRTAFDLGEFGFDNTYGYGVVHAPQSRVSHQLQYVSEFGYTATVRFDRPKDANLVLIEQTVDRGVTWERAKLAMPLSAQSDHATIFNLSPGTTYGFRLRVEGGEYHGYSTPIRHTLAEDSIPPSRPAQLHRIQRASTELMFAWEPSVDNQTVDRYEIYESGKYIGTTKETSYLATQLLPNTTYTFTVIAIDRSQNKSLSSPPLAIATETPVKYYSHSIVIDGKDDFYGMRDEMMQTSHSEYLSYVSWDDMYIYVGYSGPNLASDSLVKKQSFYLYFAGQNGTNSRLNPDVGQALPISAKQAIRLKLDDSGMERFVFDKSWRKVSTYNKTEWARKGDFFEMRIPRKHLGDPAQLQVYAYLLQQSQKRAKMYAFTAASWYDLRSMVSPVGQLTNYQFHGQSLSPQSIDLNFKAPVGADVVDLLISDDNGNSWNYAVQRFTLDQYSNRVRIQSLQSKKQYLFRIRVVGGMLGGPEGNTLGGSAIIAVTTK